MLHKIKQVFFCFIFFSVGLLIAWPTQRSFPPQSLQFSHLLSRAGWMVAPQKIHSHPNPWSLGMWSYWKKGFAYVAKDFALRYYPRLPRWALDPVRNFLIRDRRGKDRHMGKRPCNDGGREGRDVATSLGMPKPPEASRGKKGFPTRACGGRWPCWHLHFRILASRTMKEYIFVIISHPVVVICYGSLETQTVPLS